MTPKKLHATTQNCFWWYNQTKCHILFRTLKVWHICFFWYLSIFLSSNRQTLSPCNPAAPWGSCKSNFKKDMGPSCLPRFSFKSASQMIVNQKVTRWKRPEGTMVDLEADLLTEIFQPLLRHATVNLFLGKDCLLICTFWLNDVSMLSAAHVQCVMTMIYGH